VTEVLSRRSLLGGLLAAPAIVAVGSLMPLRGIKYDPLIRVQSWPIGTDACGEWWSHEGPLSKIGRIEDAMREMYGNCYWQAVNPAPGHLGPSFVNRGYQVNGTIAYEDGVEGSRLGVRPTKDEQEEFHRSLGVIKTSEFRGFPAPVYDPVAFAKSTEALEAQLRSISRWGS
jgi:hypothetical protein